MAEPRGNEFYGGGRKQTIQGIAPLGVGAVTTISHIVGSIPRNCVVTGIRFYGQDAPTATSLTAEVFARTTAGAAGVTLQSAATDIDFASQAIALAGVQASLTATVADLRPAEDRLIEATFTANTCSAGPGDLLVSVEFEPRI